MWLNRGNIPDIRPSIKDVVSAWPGGAVGVLTGNSRAFALAHSWIVRHYQQQRRVRIVDCAVRFDSNSLVDELLRQDIDVDLALLSIDVRRAFTPYQILEAIHEIEQSGQKNRDVYYVMAPFKQYFDGDVANDEASYLLHMMNERIANLGRAGWSLVIVEKQGYNHPAFASAYQQLKCIGKPVWEIADVQQPTGVTSVFRTLTIGESHGSNHRAVSHSNGINRNASKQVSTSAT